MKRFNTEAICDPDIHYMVDTSNYSAAKTIRLIDEQKYFTINRPRQYGKSHMLLKLAQLLKGKYYVLSMSLQAAGTAEFSSEANFIRFFDSQVARGMTLAGCPAELIALWNNPEPWGSERYDLPFSCLRNRIVQLCTASDRGIVLMVDEADSCLDNQIMINFLRVLRENYIAAGKKEERRFQSVILASITDIKHLKVKLRPDDQHSQNSPWNIAADFNVDMSFSTEEIAGMLRDYEADHQTGMDITAMAALLREYTSGYPVLVARLCKIIDEDVLGTPGFESGAKAWSREGFLIAVKAILEEENNPLFADMLKQLSDHPELDKLLRNMLLKGKTLCYAPDDDRYQLGKLYGFLKRDGDYIRVANRIFQTRLYNHFLKQEDLDGQLEVSALDLKSRFEKNGHLDMDLVLTTFQRIYGEVYGNRIDSFLEDNGRDIFLLYLKTIINGTGHYYVEAVLSDGTRTDVVVDYKGEQFVIEMKIWRGQAYNADGEVQLVGYLNKYHLDKGWMLTFSFLKNKVQTTSVIKLEGKTILEIVV